MGAMRPSKSGGGGEGREGRGKGGGAICGKPQCGMGAGGEGRAGPTTQNSDLSHNKGRTAHAPAVL